MEKWICETCASEVSLNKLKSAAFSRLSFEQKFKLITKGRCLPGLDLTQKKGKQELAFRGYDESSLSFNTGNFLELVDFLAKYDGNLETHLQSTSGSSFTGLSNRTQNDLISSVSKLAETGSSERDMLPNSAVTNMDLPDVTDMLEETEQVLRQCFTEYEIDEVFLSFNGGKDCTVLLDMTLNVLREMYKRDDIASELKVVYIRTNGPFREIETFVEQIKDHYGVTLMVTEGELKTTLQRLLDQDNRLKAGLMGTRRTDPYSENLKFMQKTDPSWPQIVRVSPLLNWSYHQIWSYTLQRRVPYCSLYDKGYTSIGSVHNTWPNPALATKNNFDCISYLPAWRLSDASLERAGRGTAPKIPVNGLGTYSTINGHSNENNHIDNSDHLHPSCV